MIVSHDMFMKVNELAWFINGLRPHNVEGLPTVFVNYYGHCGAVEVIVYEKGWTLDYDPSEAKSFRFNSAGFNECQACIEYLERLLKEKRECLGL